VVSVAGVFMAAAPGNWQGAAALVSSEDPAPCCALATPPRNNARLNTKIQENVRIVTSGRERNRFVSTDKVRGNFSAECALRRLKNS
jgi:hypothetical protein